jgi:NAD(P)-dependent dehydrogenase (short-subunit alcohol dehydrogenase family)
MTTLVAGASGATGRLLVEQLLNRGQNVKVVVRSLEKLPEVVKNHDNLSVIHASILNLSDARLVTEATRRLCTAIKANKSETPVKFVLMNTVGNRNRDLNEHISFVEKCIIGLFRLLVPPQLDNEKAADYLRIKIGLNNGAIEWTVVRPDTLIDENEVTAYEVHPSPIRSVVFNAGQTSRINVGHFMTDLITDDDVWNKWKGQMPVIYNKAPSGQ